MKKDHRERKAQRRERWARRNPWFRQWRRNQGDRLYKAVSLVVESLEDGCYWDPTDGVIKYLALENPSPLFIDLVCEEAPIILRCMDQGFSPEEALLQAEYKLGRPLDGGDSIEDFNTRYLSVEDQLQKKELALGSTVLGALWAKSPHNPWGVVALAERLEKLPEEYILHRVLGGRTAPRPWPKDAFWYPEAGSKGGPWNPRAINDELRAELIELRAHNALKPWALEVPLARDVRPDIPGFTALHLVGLEAVRRHFCRLPEGVTLSRQALRRSLAQFGQEIVQRVKALWSDSGVGVFLPLMGATINGWTFQSSSEIRRDYERLEGTNCILNHLRMVDNGEAGILAKEIGGVLYHAEIVSKGGKASLSQVYDLWNRSTPQEVTDEVREAISGLSLASEMPDSQAIKLALEDYLF